MQSDRLKGFGLFWVNSRDCLIDSSIKITEASHFSSFWCSWWTLSEATDLCLQDFMYYTTVISADWIVEWMNKLVICNMGIKNNNGDMSKSVLTLWIIQPPLTVYTQHLHMLIAHSLRLNPSCYCCSGSSHRLSGAYQCQCLLNTEEIKPQLSVWRRSLFIPTLYINPSSFWSELLILIHLFLYGQITIVLKVITNNNNVVREGNLKDEKKRGIEIGVFSEEDYWYRFIR